MITVKVKVTTVQYATIPLDTSDVEWTLYALEEVACATLPAHLNAISEHPVTWEPDEVEITIDEVRDEQGRYLGENASDVEDALRPQDEVSQG